MKNNKGFGAVEALLIVVIVGLIGFVGWFVYNRNNSNPKTLDAVLKQITEDANSTFSNAHFEPKYNWSAEASATAFNDVEGFDYSVSGVGKGIWLAFEYSDKSTTTQQFLFFKRTTPPAKSIDEVKSWAGGRLIKYGFSTTDNKTYKKDNNTCNILNDPTALFPNQTGNEEINTNLMEITCYGKEVLRDAAAQMKPFVDEYVKANPDSILSDMTVGPLTIKSKYGAGVIGSSHAAGYDIAEMVVSTKSKKQIALYYSKGSDWHYVTQANDEFGFKCGDMKVNADSRKAFYDQVCLSENGQVRLDTNNRALQ